MLHDKIAKTVVLSLPEDVDRRKHIKKHFSSIGICNYSYFDAITPSNDAVKSHYVKGKVVGFPACFRCKKNQCSCKNNIITPQQVANWLSFANIWKYLANEKKGSYFLICEDDVVFHENAIPLLNDFIDSFVPKSQKILVRLVTSGSEPYKNLSETTKLLTHNKPVMSNAAYIISTEMAVFLVEKFGVIDTTSDIWLHRRIAAYDDVDDVTVGPLIGTELSFNKEYALFQSRIHPKGIDSEDIERQAKHVKRVDSAESYQEILNKWFGIC